MNACAESMFRFTARNHSLRTKRDRLTPQNANDLFSKYPTATPLNSHKHTRQVHRANSAPFSGITHLLTCPWQALRHETAACEQNDFVPVQHSHSVHGSSVGNNKMACSALGCAASSSSTLRRSPEEMLVEINVSVSNENLFACLDISKCPNIDAFGDV
jgi:hypothetical protein